MSESDISRLYMKLQEMNTKLDNLTESFNRAAHGEGFVRCARHSQRIRNTETSLDLAHSRVTGVKKWIIGVLISIATVAANYAWSMLQSAAGRH